MIFSTFFYQKTPPGPHMNRQKRFRKIFFVFVKKFAKTCEKHVSVVNDYADIVSAQPRTTLTHDKLFYFGKSKKLTKNVIWYFRKLRVGVVIDYMHTMSPQSLTTWTRAEIVIDYADIMLAYSLTTPTRCRRSPQLPGDSVSVVDEYGDTVSAQSKTNRTSCPHSQQHFWKTLKTSHKF